MKILLNYCFKKFVKRNEISNLKYNFTYQNSLFQKLNNIKYIEFIINN